MFGQPTVFNWVKIGDSGWPYPTNNFEFAQMEKCELSCVNNTLYKNDSLQ